jgi:hypothetical protein
MRQCLPRRTSSITAAIDAISGAQRAIISSFFEELISRVSWTPTMQTNT